jgi:Na+/H+ antiporter NhaD/arsenite permease-like protein
LNRPAAGLLGAVLMVSTGVMIRILLDPALMWKVLALATTFAGNLTIIGSVANMIVVESAREHLEIVFGIMRGLAFPSRF